MSWVSLGSLALPFQMQRNGVQLRDSVAQHSAELTTGRVAAPQQHLRGDLGELAVIESRLGRIQTYETVIGQNETVLETAQTSLQRFASLGALLSNQVLTAAFADSGDQSYESVGSAARTALGDMVSVLSVSVAGRTLFSGAAVDRGPLVSADQILAEVETAVSGLQTADEIHATLESFFLDPGGVFETAIYQGTGQSPGGALDDAQVASPLPDAADPAIRRHLMAVTMAALMEDPDLGLSRAETRNLAFKTMEEIESNGGAVTGLQAGIGFDQELLEQRLQRLSHERDSLVRARQGLIGTDPFESASVLEETRHRLESLYALTSRISRLSLLEYLR
ncbi:MAG: flagellar hook-associated protein 3 FlgL [Rhodobacteraceae bacterium HLUCCA12]|nr:MAG: flagellar hook-associated protein 3 FlgL [Rhodobacteraceae bacterium HLUCCA12]